MYIEAAMLCSLTPYRRQEKEPAQAPCEKQSYTVMRFLCSMR
jgi:hypothetical protein